MLGCPSTLVFLRLQLPQEVIGPDRPLEGIKDPRNIVRELGMGDRGGGCQRRVLRYDSTPCEQYVLAHFAQVRRERRTLLSNEILAVL
jgi:hypothetical protein